MLPVVTGRFLFSQAPDLLLPMGKQGSCSLGGSRLGALTLPRGAQLGRHPSSRPGWVA